MDPTGERCAGGRVARIVQPSDLAVAGNAVGERPQIVHIVLCCGNPLKTSFMHRAIRCAWVEWPLGKDAWPGISIGGSSAGQSCDGRGLPYRLLKYIATNVPTKPAMLSTFVVAG